MNREIKIVPVLNGFICHVGCQIVVFESRERLIMKLGRYLDNPALLEKEFIESAVNPEVYRNPAINQACEERARVQGIVDAPPPYEPVPGPLCPPPQCESPEPARPGRGQR